MCSGVRREYNPTWRHQKREAWLSPVHSRQQLRHLRSGGGRDRRGRQVGVGIFTSLGFQVKDIPSGFSI
jgi:hypothetical protein